MSARLKTASISSVVDVVDVVDVVKSKIDLRRVVDVVKSKMDLRRERPMVVDVVDGEASTRAASEPGAVTLVIFDTAPGSGRDALSCATSSAKSRGCT